MESALCRISVNYQYFPTGRHSHPIPRGRAKQQSQNSRAYQKKHGRHVSKLSLQSNQPMHESLSVPPLSSCLIVFATIPLPTSNLFHEASCSADALDESDLYLWERDPPYNYPEPFMTADEVCYTQDMVDVLIGRRWRLAKVARDERALCFANGKVQDLLG